MYSFRKCKLYKVLSFLHRHFKNYLLHSKSKFLIYNGRVVEYFSLEHVNLQKKDRLCVNFQTELTTNYNQNKNL